MDIEKKTNGLARAFRRLGWLGFWAQVTIGTIPVVLMIYAVIFGSTMTAGTRGGVTIIQYLAIADLLVLAFTTAWSYRYTRLGRRLADPELRPSASLVQQAAWTGVAGSALGILLSVLVMLFEVVQLLIYFLRAPQAGVPVIQTAPAGPSSWVSAADIVALLALNISLLIELVVLALSLSLLFRSRLAAAELVDFGDEE